MIWLHDSVEGNVVRVVVASQGRWLGGIVISGKHFCFFDASSFSVAPLWNEITLDTENG